LEIFCIFSGSVFLMPQKRMAQEAMAQKQKGLDVQAGRANRAQTAPIEHHLQRKGNQHKTKDITKERAEGEQP
jgi:hypothetical protein